jgi:alpha-1,6-mannosyltransferase
MRDRRARCEDGDLRRPPLWLGALAGVIGELCIGFGVSQHGSPFTLTGPGAWFFGNGASATPNAVTTNVQFLTVMLVYAGIALMLVAWYEIVQSTRARTAVPITSLVAILVSWEIPILVMPPLFSRDVYYYAAQVDMVARGMNP